MEDRGQVHIPAVLSPTPIPIGYEAGYAGFYAVVKRLPLLGLKSRFLGRHAAGTTVDSFHCCGSSSVVKQMEGQQTAIQDACVTMRTP
jgi:hypothetical protein